MMVIERPHSRCRRYCTLGCKHGIKVTSALLVPLLLTIFTVVITFEQRKDSELQRQQDLNASSQSRRQDMEIAKQQREMDERKRQQDYNISLLTRQQDKTIADEKRLADNLNAEKQRNMSRELDELRYEQERQKYYDALLLSYMNDIGQILKENNGSLASNPIASALARAKTLQVIRPIGCVRSVQLIYFLYDVGQLTKDKDPLDLKGAHFDNANFFLDLPLRNISLVGTYLSNVSFAGQDVSGADFRGAHLTGANFSRANCTNATFEGATMITTDFSHAVLSFSSFIDIQLNASKFTYANCMNATFGKSTTFDVDFSYCNIALATFRKVDLTRGIFHSTYGKHITFSHAKMEKTNFTKSSLDRSTFVESILRGSDFRNVAFESVYFEYCDIESVDFTGAYMIRSMMRKSSLAFSTLVNTQLPNTQFYYSDISHANLSGSCCSTCGFPERCGENCIWVYRNVLSQLGTILCNGTVKQEVPFIRNGRVSCSNTSTLKDDWDEVSEIEPKKIRLNNSDICVLAPSSGETEFVISNVNISRFENFIKTGDAVATLRVRMTESVQIYIERDPINFQFHDGPETYTLVQSKSYRILPDTTKLSIKIEIMPRMNLAQVRFHYIELTISPRPPEL